MRRCRFGSSSFDYRLPVEMDVAHVVTLREGKFARVDEYYDRAEALQAVGLFDY